MGQMFLTTEELAERWDCAAPTIRWRQANGKMPIKPIKLLGTNRYRISDVEAYENSRSPVLGKGDRESK
jgi:hypothetical protein